MISKCIHFLIWTTASLNLSAQDIAGTLNNYLAAAAADHSMNGNILVADGGEIKIKKSFGYSNFEDTILNKDATLFPLASISKTFTSVAILQLKERGKLRLDDPFIRYFPDFPFSTITIRQLLSHTSGLPDMEAVFDSLVNKNPGKIFTNADVLPALKIYAGNHLLLFQPGETWRYSNIGFQLLAILVEKISNESFALYIEKNIFRPAGMINSYVQTNLSQAQEANRTTNYQYNNHFEMRLQKMDTLKDWKEWTFNLTGLYGSNNVISNTIDLMHYDQALYNGALLQKASLDEAFTPMQLNNGEKNKAIAGASAGLGWFIFNDTTNGKIVWHSGSNPGVTTLFARNISKKQTSIILQNVTGAQRVYSETLDIIKGKMLTYKKSAGFVYGQDLYQKGTDYATAHLKTLEADSIHFVLLEAEIDRIGLEFSRTKFQELSLEAYKINTILFPNSWKANCNYAIALSNKKENKEAAILLFQKTLLLNPSNADAKKRLDTLLKQ
jgi:CubicO group peptidase (beta-lactamase class C family)